MLWVIIADACKLASYCAVSLAAEVFAEVFGPDGYLATGDVMVMKSISMEMPTY